jgi:hypothetical protein
MFGAIAMTAVFALLASTLAPIGNFAIARDFPHYEDDRQADILFHSPIALRFMQYWLVTNIFYYQSLVLWGLLAVLVAYKVLPSV